MSPSTAPGVTVACAPSESSPPPEVIKAGLMGPRLATLACYLKGTCHGSYRTVQSFLSEVLGLNLSVGLLAKAVGKMTAALHDSYQELTVALPRQPVLGIDETGLRHMEKATGCGAPMYRALKG